MNQSSTRPRSPAPEAVSGDDATIGTLVELLTMRAREGADREAYVFLAPDMTEAATLTFGALDRRARAIACALSDAVEPGARILLLYPPSLDYVAAFFGCLYAGAIAVPAYPPDPTRFTRTLPRLQALAAHAEPSVVLTTSAFLDAKPLVGDDPALSRALWWTTDRIDLSRADGWRMPSVSPETLAFIQYTSGSTGTPRGVALTHENLLRNLRGICDTVGPPPQVFVSWLPLYHDMGLIGGVLSAAFMPAKAILFSPLDFLRRPASWLEALTRHRATVTAAPNFAFELAVRRTTPADRKRFDLSALGSVWASAEPVRATTLARFEEAFQPCGLRPDAVRTCYGLAEATLLVAAGSGRALATVRHVRRSRLADGHVDVVAADEPGTQALVGSGEPMEGNRLLVVDPATALPCADGRLGEIWVAGPCVAASYWNDPQETARVLQARLAQPGDGRWLRTGDLGFVAGGEVFVTGRLKDLIIVRGRNHHPVDIERTIEACHPSLRPGGGAVFSIEVHDEERVVVVHEVNPASAADWEPVMAAVRSVLAETHELVADAIVLVEPRAVPKTSSGKTQRHACRAAYLGGDLAVVAAWERGAAIEPAQDVAVRSWLVREVATALHADPHAIEVGAPLTHYGLDSLLAVDLAQRIEAYLGRKLRAADLLAGASIADVVGAAAEMPARRAPHATAAGDDAEHPLSRNQQALWFLHELAPTSSAYNLAHAVRTHGHVDLATFQRALDAVVDRHAALRTTFGARAGVPFQRIGAQLRPRVTWEDGTAWGDEELDGHLARLAARPFDLSSAEPLLRVTVVRRAPDVHVVLIIAHHVVTDLWSLTILLRELGACYAAPEAVARPAARYVDYVHEQNEWLQGVDVEQRWEYWRAKLQGDLGTLELPGQLPRPPIQTYEGAVHRFVLDASLAERLDALARAHGVTRYVVLLAAFSVVLHRSTGRTDVTVGSYEAGRDAAEWARTVGYLANPLPLRLDLDGDPSFAALLERVQRVVFGALAHALPFSLLVERLQPRRDPSRSPLFQIVFAFQQAPADAAELAPLVANMSGPRVRVGALELEAHPIAPPGSPFDLVLNLTPAAGTLVGALCYNPALFEPETISRMAAQLETALAAVVADPARSVSAVPLMDAAELRRVVVEWNATSRPAVTSCVHERIAARAAQHPDAVAVEGDGGRLTYRELNARANALACRLRARGLHPGSTVAVAVERSIRMPVALLAVLKAGGAYVPLDPADPVDRQAFVLADVEAPLLLTERAQGSRLPPPPMGVALLDDHPDAEDEAGLAPSAGLDDLANVIYTSGSTGRPKGTEITHRALANVFASLAREPGLHGGDTVLALTTIAFDIAAAELLLPLTVGARIVVAPRATAVDGHALAATLAAHDVTVLQATPATFRLLAAAGWGGKTDLRLWSGGEALTGDLARWLLAHGAEVWNLYGPTETTIYSTCARVRPQDTAVGARSVTIGRPIDNTEAYLLDDRREPVPIGVTGEIHLGGTGLARGYRNRPELTADRFIANPLRPGHRLYRTGDLGRYRADGAIEYLGRADDQVKLRGFRVELGEIEAVLAEHPAVRQAVVVMREDRPGDPRLVAYLVPAEPAAPAPAELRAFLARQLPAHMLPSAFVALDGFPRTSRGKTDRRVLPAPSPDALAHAHATAPPSYQTRVTERLARLWAEVLGVPSVGPADDFFALGGHSLLATQLISRVRETFDVELPLRTLFETPTLDAVAAAIELPARDTTPAFPVATERPRDASLSFAQERLWILHRLDPTRATYNVPYRVDLRGPLDAGALRRGLAALVARHEVLRTTFPVMGDRPVARIAPPGPVDVDVVDLRALPSAARTAELDRIGHAVAVGPFDIERGPLLRCRVVRMADTTHVLLLCLHHIICDGWALGVLVRDLSAFYGGTGDALPAIPLQYADLAAWQREQLAGERVDAQRRYWTRRLTGAVPFLDLPIDRPRPATPSGRGAQHALRWPRTLVDGLHGLARHERATLFMTLAAGFAALLQRYTGQDDIPLGTLIANRTRRASEDVIGLFLNTLVLRTDCTGDPSFRTLLARVRETALGAYAHQDLPFEHVLAAVKPTRDLAHTPLFQVMIVIQNAPLPPIAFPGIESQACAPIPTDTAKVDLQLDVTEDDDGLHGFIEYSTDLFDAPTIARLAGHLETLLAAAIAEPDRPLSMLPVLDVMERHRLLDAWNRTAAPSPECRAVDLVEAQCERTPDAIAVVDDDGPVTYRVLDRRANQVAHALQRAGIGRESVVGLCLTRSAQTVAAILGIWKAGAAYLPLHPGDPPSRLALMLDEAESRVIVTDAQHADELGPTGRTLLRVEDLAGGPATRPSITASASDLATVIYTSGSTGRPKGVLVPHGAIVNRLTHEPHPFDRDEVCAQKTGLGFVDSLWEMFAPLTRGLRTVVIPDDAVRDPRALIDRFARASVTRVVLVPSLLGAILDLSVDLAGPLSRLRLWISTGEPLRADLAERFAHRLPDATLLNLYGTSEVWDALCGEVTNGEARTVPVGRPMANVRVYVVDGRLQPVPIGASGELCVAGAGLARGYLARAELTAARFVPDPFSHRPGAMLYRTGDRARLRPDGTVEVLGRADRQLKIRGVRVDPGEVEAALGAHPGVRAAAVVAREGATGPELVAYVVLEHHGPAPAELRAFVAGRLPSALVPSVVTPIDALPRTPSGKLDRRALPALAPTSTAHVARTPPRDALEARLAQIWEALLGVSVGVTESFFDLGGHSLLAVAVVERVARELGRELPVAAVFQEATIERLAARLRAQNTGQAGSLVLIRPGGAAAPLFCVHPAGGHVFEFGALAAHMRSDRPIYGFEHPALHGGTAPERLAALATRYVDELRAVQPQGPYHLLGWSFGGVVAVEMARQLRERGGGVAFVGLLDTWAPGAPLDGDDANALVHFARTRGIELSPAELQALAPSERITRFLALGHGAGALPAGLGAAEVARVLAVYRANVDLLRDYVPESYAGQLTVLRAAQGTSDPRSDPARWERFTTLPPAVHVVPGDHDTVLAEPHVATLAVRLEHCLDERSDDTRHDKLLFPNAKVLTRAR